MVNHQCSLVQPQTPSSCISYFFDTIMMDSGPEMGEIARKATQHFTCDSERPLNLIVKVIRNASHGFG
jgi:hypothetical protein